MHTRHPVRTQTVWVCARVHVGSSCTEWVYETAIVNTGCVETIVC